MGTSGAGVVARFRERLVIASILVIGLVIGVVTSVAAITHITWNTKAPMTSARYGLGLALAPNGKLYAMGGAEGGGATARVEEYDPATNTWTSCTPRPSCAFMPTPRQRMGIVTAGNGRIYAIGGFNNGADNLATVDEYDPIANVWTAKAPMSTGRVDFGVAAVGNKIYAIGGADSVGALASVEEYDVVSNTWTPMAPMAAPRIGLAAAAVNGRVYAIGGATNTQTSLANVEELNPGTNSWSPRASLLSPRFWHAAVTAANGKIYALGGISDPNVGSSNSVEEYDPVANVWVATTRMINARAFAGVATVGNTIHAVGVFGYTNLHEAGTIRDRPTAVTPAAVSDFDRDAKTDVAVFHPQNSSWYAALSGGSPALATVLGQAGDIPVADDYDGDGRVDVAVFRPSNPNCPSQGALWFALLSGGGSTGACLGQAGDIPVPADYDDDSRTDLAIVRPTAPACPGQGPLWFVVLSEGGTLGRCFGSAGDVPLAADLDADGRADLIVYRPSSGHFFATKSQGGTTTARLGTGGDTPIAADFDGDYRADFATFRQNGTWTILLSACAGDPANCAYSTVLGGAGDIPVVGDYNADGRADLAIFHAANGSWYVQPSGSGAPIQTVLGQNGDIPAAKRPSYPGASPSGSRESEPNPAVSPPTPRPLGSPTPGPARQTTRLPSPVPLSPTSR